MSAYFDRIKINNQFEAYAIRKRAKLAQMAISSFSFFNTPVNRATMFVSQDVMYATFVCAMHE